MSFFKVHESENFLRFDFSIPETSNALSLSAARELGALQRAHRKWKKPVIVRSLHPRLFCSGGNLSDYKKLKGKAPGLKINREIKSLLDAFGAWQVPKLAIVEGDALGGGMEWLARFDYRFATPSAYFAFWQRRIGLSTGWGGGKAWALKVGDEKVRKLLLEARPLSAHQAEREGLIDRVFSSWAIHQESELWAARLTAASVGPLMKWKSSREEQVFGALWMAPEHQNVLNKWKS